jgi:hypothetical protein
MTPLHSRVGSNKFHSEQVRREMRVRRSFRYLPERLQSLTTTIAVHPLITLSERL